MKIIRSFFLAVIMLCVTDLLHAQDVKAEVGKTIEPKQSTADNRPSPAFKPQDGTVLSAPAKVAEKPSPEKEEPRPTVGMPKPAVKTIDSDPAKTLTAEQLRTLEGKTEKPKPVILKAQKDQ